MKKVLIGTFVALLLVSGCGKVPKLQNGQEAIVTLKGDDISIDSLYNELKEDYALNSLINMIDKQILNDLYPSDKDETDYIDTQMETIKYYYENYYKSQYDSFLSYIKAQGFKDEVSLKDYFALDHKRQLATKAYVKEDLTDKEIKKYYQDKIYGDITTSHILVTPDYEENATDAVKKTAEEKALKEAKEIIKKLKSGNSFATLAKELSDDSSSKASGGSLPAFNKGQQSDEYESAALKLEIGKYTTTPVKDQYGYHIILKTAQADKPKLDDVKDDIINQLVNEKMTADQNIQAKALIQLRKNNEIKIQDDSLRKQYEAYIESINK